MKKVLFATVAISLVLSCTAYAADDTEARTKAAELCLKASPPEDLVNQMLDGIAKNPRAQMTPADEASIKASIDFKVLHKAMLDAMVKDFTADELKMMATFYGSPEGQSIMKKMPGYMNDIKPVMMQQVQGQIVDFMKKKQGMSPAGAAPLGAMSVAPTAQPPAPAVAAPVAAPAAAPPTTPTAPATPAAPAAQ